MSRPTPPSRRRAPLLALTALLLVPAAGFAVATGSAQGAPPPPVVAVSDALRAAMMKSAWDEARAEIGRLEETRPAEADLWLYLRAVLADHEGEGERAAAALLDLEVRFPESAWIHKARFRRAELLRDQGLLAEAEAIWEAEAERLLSDGRKRELAGLYLRFADELSTPPETPGPENTLDYERAHALYAKAIELEAPRDVRDRALFRMGLCRQEQERWNEAATTYQRYLETFDPSRSGGEAARAGAGEHVLSARHRLGQCQAATGAAQDARRTWEDLVAILAAARAGEAPWRAMFGDVGSPERRAALALAGDAAFAVASTWSSGSAEETPLAIAALERYLRDFPEHTGAERAAFEIGERYRSIGRGEDALAAFAAFLERPVPATEDAERREEAERLRRRALYLRGQVHLERKEFEEASAAWSDYAARYPTGADWDGAQRGIVDAEYAIGDHLAGEHEWADARTALARFAAAHPLDGRSRAIQLRIADLFRSEARALLDRPDEPEGLADADGARTTELFRSAIAQWRRVAAKYAGQNEASEALFAIGSTHESDLREPEEAIAAYRECDFGPRAGDARMRLEIMTKPSLAVRTERTWRSGETPRVRVDVRNVERLGIELYALDLEAYFRKHLTHRAVEALDIDLIEPDQRLDAEIDDYAPYRPIRQDVELPVEGPGVWAVVVTTDEERATTLVIQSDIDLVAKSSRREVFVWAEDMSAGQPAAGVRVLVALQGASGTTIEELETDADGVARLASEELTDSPSVRVFGARDGHVASNGVAIAGLALSPGLAPKGLVYTDRPAYQPGQTVHWRGVFRDVVDGAFAFRSGKLWRAEILDPAGRAVLRRTLEQNDFGALADDFELAPNAPVGTWRITCQDGEGPVFSRSFEVARYELRPVELGVEIEKPVWYRGEEIEVSLRAAWYYGEPLVGAPLSAVLPDGRRLDLVSDAEGRASFSFDTRDVVREGPIVFMARLPEEGVEARGSAWVATRGWSAALETTRTTLLAGESFEVTLRTATPDGEPAARAASLALVRRETGPNGRVSEVLVERRDVETDALGIARTALAIDTGGDWLVRAEGLDRFGNPVIAELPLMVSDDDDPVRLRLLADAHTFAVGRTATANLFCRAGAGLALVTWEAEGVIDYRLVELAEGANEIAFEVEHEHAPGVTLAAALMQGARFHEASIDFAVERGLTVAIEPEGETWTPGQEATVRIAVTDQAGRPVACELSLAVVDDALFDLYSTFEPDALQALFDVGQRQRGAVRTATTCAFRYDGVTTRIDEEILAERLRVETAALFAERRAQSLESLAELEDKEEVAPMLGAVLRSTGPATPGPQSARAHLDAGADDFFLGKGGGGRFGGRAGGRVARADVVRARLEETAFWSPAIVTDADGRARATFTLPDQATRWRMTAVGAGREAVFGGAAAKITARAELFCELELPARLVEGDDPRVVVRVHNQTGERGTAKLVLRLEGPGIRASFPASVELGDAPVTEYRFDDLEPLLGIREITVEAEVEAQLDGRTLRDGVRKQVPIEPWGLEHTATESGTVADDTTFWIELPTPVAGLRERALELSIGPGLSRMLVDVALGRRVVYPRRMSLPPTRADAAGELLGVAEALRWLGARGDVDPGILADLRSRAEGLVLQLVATQREDGAWSWIGDSQRERPETTALAMLALARAVGVGLEVPPTTVQSGVARLAASFQSAPQEADELKAQILLALAAHGRGDFGALNRLHRERARLSPAALAFTALAFCEMKRVPMAADLAALLEAQVDLGTGASLGGGPTCRWDGALNTAWNRSDVESTGWALAALQAALPRSERAAPAAAWLESRIAWAPARAQGIALAALAARETEARFASERLRVRIAVDGADAGQHVFEPGAFEPWRLVLDRADDAPARVRVDVALEGRGELFVSALLRGFSPGVEPPPAPRDLGIARHRYMAAAPVLFGRELRTGFSVLARRRGDSEWVNEVRHLPRGQTARCLLEFWCNGTREERDREFLALEIPLPAGTDVLAGSVRGSVLAHEVRDGRLVVHLGRHYGSGRVEYTLVAERPGAWRALPPMLTSLYDEGHRAYGEPLELTVLGRGEESTDTYRPTPDELFYRGSALFEDGSSPEGAWTALRALRDEFGDDLEPEILSTTARMLLFLAIEREDAREIVRAFEVLRERNPELTIPFDDVRAVGAAYRELEEYERALLVFRATIVETFGKDLKVAGALEEQAERAGAFDVLERLWLEFPDVPAVVETSLALSEKLLVAAPEAHADDSLRRAGRDRAALALEGVLLLRRFLALYPGDPLAPEAGLSLVSAHLELEDHERAAELAGEMAAVYTEPRYADAFSYSRAVAEWYLGREDEALGLLEKIAAARYEDDLGNQKPSENRDLALYILGQIHHARRDIEGASRYYEEVRELFADAREVLAGFRERTIDLPEVTTVRPGQPAALELEHRNVDEAELLVYGVDLLTLALREKNLSSITQVNLAGIAPTLQRTVALGGDSMLGPIDTEVDLELTEPGAYLAICRAGELFASGLVLVSDLEIRVREDPVAGRVRIQAWNESDGAYRRDVDVRVIGSGNERFQSGRTDPRGIYVADGLLGATTVIARQGDRHYAFHRGQELLGQVQQEVEFRYKALGQEDYLKNVLDLNRSNQAGRQQWLQSEIDRTRKGVQVQQVR